jgi:hypothetical protein
MKLETNMGCFYEVGEMTDFKKMYTFWGEN